MNHEKLLDVLEDMHWAAINIPHPERYIDSTKEELSEALKQLRELVELNTPKKVVRQSSMKFRCPNCNYMVAYASESDICKDVLSFCLDCGQALDWSEE